MDREKLNKLIEKAKQQSKDDFLRFVTGIYGVDESIFDHIWKVPVISSTDKDILVKTSLSTKTEEELLDIVDKFINEELGNTDACFILLNKMKSCFTEQELKEWQEKINSEELELDYDAIIAYNESKLQKDYKELEQINSSKANPNTQEELEQFFTDYIKGIITHERCHLNANCLVTELNKEKEETGLYSSEVNGASLTETEQDNISNSNKSNIIMYKYNMERNEVLVDTLAQMMNNYQTGDTLEDCLFGIIEKRKGRSQYDYLDDKEVLTMYILFTEELTQWATFGAYDLARQNELQKKIIEVCGTDNILSFSQFKKKVEEYVSTLEKNTLSEKQIKMLEMLGIPTSRQIKQEGVTGVFSGSLLDVNNFIQNIKKEDDSMER